MKNSLLHHCKRFFVKLQVFFENIQKFTLYSWKGNLMSKIEDTVFPEIIDRFSNYQNHLNRSPATINQYRMDLMLFVKYQIAKKENLPTIGEEFDKIDIRTYAQRVFSMYSGKKKRVTIRFINMLLDVAVERFGTKDAQYSAVDDKHFTVSAEVEISDLFFGWLLSFGRRVKILYPSDVLEEFRMYIEKIRDLYMPEEENE